VTLAAGAEIVVDIAALGSLGDGVATLDGETVRVEQALPGERWRARLAAQRRGGWDALPLERLAGGERAIPACRHFGRCGGCRLQHAPAPVYAAFKRRRIESALAHRGLDSVEVALPIVSPPGARRRLRLAWSRSGGKVALGLRERRSHAVVDLAECPVARPELMALLPALRELIAGLGAAAAREGEASLTWTDSGPDLLLGLTRPPTLAERQQLAAFAGEAGLARLALAEGDGIETLATLRQPMASLAGTAVPLPAGAFLQATAEGEAALCAVVAALVRSRDRVLDLYAGIGTMAFAALAAGARAVHAVEIAPASCAALSASRVPALSVESRDLARRPLTAAELGRFDLVVLDPPRAGAAAQVRELAASAVPRLAYLSCDPESFARDARALVDGGYDLRHVQPVDQFLWSAEVELAAAFTRPAARRSRA
jgi:23S rRNA (uracil1939-C5)-methyltransferase